MFWIIPSLLFAGIVLMIDFLVRRKKWNENTGDEKIGLVLTLLFSYPFVFGSSMGILFGNTSVNGLLELVIAVIVCGLPVISLASTIAALVLRKCGKAKASNWALMIGFLYYALLRTLNIIRSFL